MRNGYATGSVAYPAYYRTTRPLPQPMRLQAAIEVLLVMVIARLVLLVLIDLHRLGVMRMAGA